MKKLMIFVFILTLFTMCKEDGKETTTQETTETQSVSTISEAQVNAVKDTLIGIYGEAAKQRIEKGVTQMATLWYPEDGTEADFKNFCVENFIFDEKALEVEFLKLSRNFEILNGNFNKISVDLKIPLHLNTGELSQTDYLFGAYEPSAHLTDDFFENKIAFFIALNFPFYSLEEKMQLGENWSRLQWAYARLGDLYTARIPANLKLQAATATTNADTYISEYNIMMGKLVNDNMQTLFPEDMKLITHWGLRDELKSNYNQDNGLEKQRMIYAVMKNIISQNIPEMVINNPEYQWNPAQNKVFQNGKEVQFTAEPNTRYQHMLNNFQSLYAMDKYNPQYPTYIEAKFEGEMEIAQQDVEALFVELVGSPEVKQVAELIKSRLGRNLEPFDIWYDGFKARNSVSETELDKKVAAKYPNRDAFQNGLTEILKKLQFTTEKANYISTKITVDASRGAGHAWGAMMRTDNARLRTRIADNGMNYKGYNIAVHEFGHCVEQTITLYDMDYYTLNGVPNTAFTEALAFIFQKRDLELLGIKDENVQKEHLMALDIFWGCYEIMGVSLVDMKVWQWLYKNPNATAEELNKAVNDISIEVWNKYYAEIFGVKDQPILAIYSHMIDYPLYLSAYPIGHLIDFQIEKQIKDKNFADEVMRIYSAGRIVPQLWMKRAVGEELSAKPLIEAVDVALQNVK